MQKHRTSGRPAKPDSRTRYQEIAFWPTDRVQAFDERRRTLETAGLSRALASARAFEELVQPGAASTIGLTPDGRPC